MQLRSTDLKFIILGIVVAHCAAEKEVNKRKKNFLEHHIFASVHNVQKLIKTDKGSHCLCSRLHVKPYNWVFGGLVKQLMENMVYVL